MTYHTDNNITLGKITSQYLNYYHIHNETLEKSPSQLSQTHNEILEKSPPQLLQTHNETPEKSLSQLSNIDI